MGLNKVNIQKYQHVNHQGDKTCCFHDNIRQIKFSKINPDNSEHSNNATKHTMSSLDGCPWKSSQNQHKSWAICTRRALKRWTTVKCDLASGLALHITIPVSVTCGSLACLSESGRFHKPIISCIALWKHKSAAAAAAAPGGTGGVHKMCVWTR